MFNIIIMCITINYYIVDTKSQTMRRIPVKFYEDYL